MKILLKVWDEKGELMHEEICDNFAEAQKNLKREFDSENMDGEKYNQIAGCKFELSVATARQIKIQKNKSEKCWNQSVRALKKMGAA